LRRQQSIVPKVLQTKINAKISRERLIDKPKKLAIKKLKIADSTRQCNFTHGMMREAAMPKCFSPSKVKEHECEPITASLRVSVTKFMR